MTFTIKAPIYKCPTHGETEHVIVSTIKGREGAWCQLCWLDTLEANGTKRVVPIEPE